MSDSDTIAIRRALISVSDKQGVAGFASELAGCGVEIISTGGTAQALRDSGVEVVDAAAITGHGSVLGGRVKTLNPALFGGVLFDRDKPGQLAELAEIGGRPIDLVVVNFYPFAEAAARQQDLGSLVELIDIGGPALVRSAAKNHRHVAVVVDPGDYRRVSDALRQGEGSLDRSLAAELAAKAFATTAAYEASIAARFAGQRADELPGEPLRYGENPHQQGSVAGGVIAQQGGGQLSYNNIQDAAVAWRAACEHDAPACAIVKHASICGLGVDEDAAKAHALALAADELSAYGGVVAVNREVDGQLWKAVTRVFCEVLIAPAFTEEALAMAAAARRVRTVQGPLGTQGAIDGRILGGLTLYQSRDIGRVGIDDLQVVTRKRPDRRTLEQLLIAWRIAKHCRSNAIVLVAASASIGIGAGQPSRLEAAQLAIERASRRDFAVAGSVAASDAFFPFADGLDALARAGVQAVIQPGGSRRDDEVIACADEAGVAMVFTGLRHFVH